MEIVEEVRCWLRSLRKDDPELGIQIAARIELLLDGPGRRPRDLVASLRGDTARSISLLELRTHGTIRIAFVYHAGTVVLLLSHGGKRNLKSGRFYDQLIDEAVDRYHRWQADEEGKR
ncbi:type II toxin-antitoxin system RelE/ParE family toxin [Nonomuraea sp. NPDC050556]|uniref:type II toxin-antitoxin system RelE/ParE family toxin n=1 Tax=Nonomuraea sp. NPDC050556 TaxID=3364369 RepID=UPI0037ACF5DC